MEHSEIDSKRAWLIPYVQGWGWKLDECCRGEFVHEKAQPRQTITTWLEILQDPRCTLDQVRRIESLIPDVIGKSRRIYKASLALKNAERAA